MSISTGCRDRPGALCVDSGAIFRRVLRRGVWAAAVSLAASATGCAPPVAGGYGAPVDSTIPMVRIRSGDPAAPFLAIPQPAGWEWEAFLQPGPVLGLLKDVGGGPDCRGSALVWVEQFAVDRGLSNAAQQQLFADSVADIRAVGRVLSVSPEELSGFSAINVDYSIRALRSVGVIAAVRAGHRWWEVRVTLFNRCDWSNPRWIVDTRSVVDGFVIDTVGRNT